ncbi:MAG: BamA/TamA family outer membrane protein [Paracoccaceae bacterium]
MTHRPLTLAPALAAAPALAVAAALMAAPAAAQDAPSATFDAIVVEGNARHGDRDVLATAGIAPGMPLTRADLEQAVEALDFTGEFREVGIAPRGDTLVITVEERAGFSGGLTFGLGYDSDAGPVLSAVASLRDAVGPGNDLDLRADLGRDRRALRAQALRRPLGEGGVTYGLRLSYDDVDDDDDPFAYERLSAGPFVLIPLGPRAEVELRAAYVRDDLTDVDSGASSILRAEAGEREGGEIGASVRLRGASDAALRWSAEIGGDAAGLGAARFDRTFARLEGEMPVGATGFALRGSLDLGAVSGAGARATDRFALGGTGLRGFAPGGVTLRDATPAGSTDLGAERYAAIRTDLVLPVFADRDGLDAFVFADAGRVWDLASAGQADGTVRVDPDWSTSAGIGVSLDAQIGRFEAYYALTDDAQPGDETQALGLAFRVDF